MIVDSVKIDPSKIRPAPGGGILIEGRVSRSGVQVYRTPDGTEVKAFRPPEEVLASDFEGSPLTVGHPPGGVTPATYRTLAVGAARRRLRVDSVQGRSWPVHALQVNDQATIDRVMAGELCELSCGYQADKVPEAGVADGEAYTVVFRNLRPNHIALGGEGFARAGRDAKLLIADGENEDDVLISDLICDDGAAPLTAPTPAAAPAPNDRDALVARIVTLEAERATLVSAKDSAEEALATVTAERDAAKSEAAKLPQAIADGVKSALALRADAAKVLPEDYAFDGKSDDEIKADIRAAKVARIKELDPDAQIQDSDAYVDAYLAAVDAAAKRAGKPIDYNASRQSVEDGKPNDFAAHVRAVSVRALKGE